VVAGLSSRARGDWRDLKPLFHMRRPQSGENLDRSQKLKGAASLESRPSQPASSHW